MGWNDHVNFELLEAIDQAVDEGELEEGTAEHGIARKVAHEGTEGLSAKQRHVYETRVVPALGRIADQNAMNERLNMSVLD